MARDDGDKWLRLMILPVLAVVGYQLWQGHASAATPPSLAPAGMPGADPPPNDGSAKAQAAAQAWVDYATKLGRPEVQLAFAEQLTALGYQTQAAALQALARAAAPS